MGSFNVNDIYWVTTLSSCDTIRYLPATELIELSLVCKFMRAKLLRYIFETITLNGFLGHFVNFPLNQVYLDSLKKEVLASYEECLKKFIPHVKDLHYGGENNEILLLSIPQVFSRLNKLQLFRSSFTLATFYKITDELKQLEHLSLEEIQFITFDVRRVPMALQLPQSLVAFKISYCDLIHVKFNPNFSINDYLKFRIETYTTTLSYEIKPGSLPRLRALILNHYDLEFATTQNNLILGSNRLIHFSTNFSFINELTFENLQYLESLTLSNYRDYPRNFLEADIPNLHSLKELKIIGEFDIEDYEENIGPCIDKLSTIAKSVEKITLTYLDFNRSYTGELLNKFAKFNELTLVKANSEECLNHENIPKTTSSLNLYNFHPNILNLNTITNLTKLKKIGIYYDIEDFEFKKSTFYKGVEGWRIIFFPGSSVKCHKE